MPPYWWPKNDEPMVLFLDEMNRVRPEILQSVMDLTLNRTLAGKKLPEGSIVISAINEGDDYQLTDLDPALVSRFNVYHFQPTVYISNNKCNEPLFFNSLAIGAPLLFNSPKCQNTEGALFNTLKFRQGFILFKPFA